MNYFGRKPVFSQIFHKKNKSINIDFLTFSIESTALLILVNQPEEVSTNKEQNVSKSARRSVRACR